MKAVQDVGAFFILKVFFPLPKRLNLAAWPCCVVRSPLAQSLGFGVKKSGIQTWPKREIRALEGSGEGSHEHRERRESSASGWERPKGQKQDGNRGETEPWVP